MTSELLHSSARASAPTVDRDPDALMPASKVLARYSIAAMTLYRWVQDERLGFPRPTVINRRRYWRVSELIEWERSRAARRAA